MTRLFASAFIALVVTVCAFGCGETTTCATATCGGACADLDLDPKNCGQCGHTCASGACAAGGCVVTDTAQSFAIVGAVGDELLVTQGQVSSAHGPRLLAFKKTGGEPRTLLERTNDAPWLLSGRKVFWSYQTDDATHLYVAQADVTPSDPTKPGGQELPLPDTGASARLSLLGATDSEIFVLYGSNALYPSGSYSRGTVFSLSSTDSSPTWKKEVDLEAATPSAYPPSKVLATKTDLWWIQPIRYDGGGVRTIQHCKRGACTPKAVTTDPARAATLAGDSLYWVEEHLPELRVMRVDASTLTSPRSLGGLDSRVLASDSYEVSIAADTNGAYVIFASIPERRFARFSESGVTHLTEDAVTSCGLTIDSGGLHYCAMRPGAASDIIAALVSRAP